MSAAPDVSETARLSAQVVKLYQAGRYAEALPLAQQILATREKALPAGNLLIAEALGNLAAVQFRLNNNAPAETLARRALALYEQARPPDENRIADTLFLLGGIYVARADYDKGLPALQRLLTLREKLSGPEHPDTLEVVLVLAQAYNNNRQFDAAEFLYRNYAEAQTRRNGPPNDIGLAWERLSCLLWRKRDDEAEKTEQRADVLRGFAAVPPLKVKSKELQANILAQPALDLTLDKKYLEEFPYFDSGAVLVRVLVSEKGEVLRSCAIYGPSFMLGFYEAAARRTRFKPFVNNNGQPAPASGELKYLYEVRRLFRDGRKPN